MSQSEIIRAFLQGKLPKRYINTKTKQFYFYHIVRAIASLNRANNNTEMYWSYCTEAYYYLRFGNGSLQNAREKTLEYTTKGDWFEQVGFERQVKRIDDIFNAIPKQVSEEYLTMLNAESNNNE